MSGAQSKAIELTRREKEIILLTAAGLPIRDIASRIGIADKTVKAHRTAIYRKLKLQGVALITRYAIRQGWVVP